MLEAENTWSVAVVQRGFEFSPVLAHVNMARGEDVVVPFRVMARFLSPEGKSAVAVFRTEPADYIPWP